MDHPPNTWSIVNSVTARNCAVYFAADRDGPGTVVGAGRDLLALVRVKFAVTKVTANGEARISGLVTKAMMRTKLATALRAWGGVCPSWRGGSASRGSAPPSLQHLIAGLHSHPQMI